MSTSLSSLIQCGTRLWLDSVDPALIPQARVEGATGATSNPAIVSDLIQRGRFDAQIENMLAAGDDDETIAWKMTNYLVSQAQQVFLPIWNETAGNDGYVSFELDPLLEDLTTSLTHEDRVARYLELGKKWSAGQQNRMIKVPATTGGLACLEELAASGVTLNVTLIFTSRQYQAAREAIWRGAQRRPNMEGFKSVYSIFVSRVDVYTEQHITDLTPVAQGQVGIVNAKRIWRENRDFWIDKPVTLEQEMIFASTGVKNPNDSPLKYISALAGSDIQTNPPATNTAISESNVTFSNQVSEPLDPAVVEEIDQKIDFDRLKDVLMAEGLRKFADPQKALLNQIAEKRGSLAAR
jgi:transaldolase